MLISTRGRYALRIMIDLAEHQTEDGYVPLKDSPGNTGAFHDFGNGDLFKGLFTHQYH